MEGVMVKEAKKDNKVAVSFWIDKDLVDKLDYLADKGGLTKSKLLSNIVEAVVHDMMLVDKVGIVRLASFLQDLREAIKNKIANKNKKIIPILMNNEGDK
jgi:predicted DNA-binding protein